VTTAPTSLARALSVAQAVVDPELPMLTLADLGVLRHVEIDQDGMVTVTITPTYTACPAMGAMRDDLRRALAEAGFVDVEVHTVLHPPWSTDWVSATGRRKLADAGIVPPGSVPVRLLKTVHVPTVAVSCPQCGSARTEELSRFGATACRDLRRCLACLEPFEHMKEI
jgi:ring-1,2-phenylacetyl-CoA epoxidase subunit PaaD